LRGEILAHEVELLASELAVGLEVEDVDERDEVDAAEIERKPPVRRVLAAERGEELRRPADDVVLAGSTTSGARSPASSARAASSCSAFARCVTSPVCTTNAGCRGSALIASIARFNVPATSGLASCAKPMWLSLICTNSGAPEAPAATGLAANAPPGERAQAIPAPVQATCSRNARRLIAFSSPE
jgi:hypothetical protein